MRTLGDAYVKSEFQQHRTASPSQASSFLSQWSTYASDIENERNRRLVDISLKGDDMGRGIGWGRDLEKEEVKGLSEEQREQIERLKREARGEMEGEEEGGEDNGGGKLE
jgi:hypothetical protein